jgi:hypothetical protein
MHPRLLALCFALIALTSAARADHDRPFNGTLTSTVTSSSVTDDGLLHLEGTVAGKATVIGRLTGTFSYDLDPATGAFTGTLTKVAANGDEIHETFTGQFNADFTASSGEFQIADGTGRFEGVTGGGPFAGRVTSATTVVIRFTGTISQGK